LRHEPILEAAAQKYRRAGTMFECLVCHCREVKAKMEKHHLQEHLTLDEDWEITSDIKRVFDLI
jgi:hypothetical protein